MKTVKQEYVETLLAQKLTFSEFEAKMNKIGVFVVKPGSVVSMVYFNNEIRFFPSMTELDIVVGGYFG